MSIERKRIEKNKENNGSQKISSFDCRDTALLFLNRRDRSVHEVRQHLASRDFDREEIDVAIAELIELGYLDDFRYCENYLRYAMGKGRGPGRVAAELKDKGLDPALIQEIVKEGFGKDAEKEAAMKEAQKILHAKSSFYAAAELINSGSNGESFDEGGENIPREIDDKTIAKIGRRLSSLGYRTDVIYDIMSRIRKKSDFFDL
ncbi:regulatory protein RecX [Anoxybacterium hadale]|uniref:Regulatory protein RecX n=1 Tax=Anoxybacterium hadale TaxID=3408580 RepID=A0ACD1AA17_9FIRM|nr:regulatory protein RecX [Clostridiales bacterium]